MRNRFGLSRTIPTNVKKQVRRRCGFGCVICGSAIHTYEHFDPPFRDAREHLPAGITLLCGSHQLESSKGLLSKTTIAQADAAPFCHKAGHSSQMLDLGASRPTLLLGGTSVTDCGPGVALNGEWLLRIRPPELRSSRWRLSARFPSPAGATVCQIVDNELLLPCAPFEIEQAGMRFVARDDSSVLLDMELLPPNRFSIRKYTIPIGNGEIFVGEQRVKNPISGAEEFTSVLEFRNSAGLKQTFVNCAFRSDMGINFTVDKSGFSFGRVPITSL